MFNLDELTSVHRFFQYDYIYIDFVFLCLWVGVLAWKKEWKALAFGACIAPIIYSIDAGLWWNSLAGPPHAPGTFIREYFIGGVQVSHPAGSLTLQKFGADFMMTLSYSLYAFPWLFIAFREIREGRFLKRGLAGITVLWLGFWLLVPALSVALPLNESIVHSVRHMNSQFVGWVVNLLVGYSVLLCLYRKVPIIPLQLFMTGCVGSLIMEVPLYLFGIRPVSLPFLIYEGIFLLNQGVPWLFLFVDKVLPWCWNMTTGREMAER